VTGVPTGDATRPLPRLHRRAPPYDHAEVTSLAAATVAHEMVALMARGARCETGQTLTEGMFSVPDNV